MGNQACTRTSACAREANPPMPPGVSSWPADPALMGQPVGGFGSPTLLQPGASSRSSKGTPFNGASRTWEPAGLEPAPAWSRQKPQVGQLGWTAPHGVYGDPPESHFQDPYTEEVDFQHAGLQQMSIAQPLLEDPNAFQRPAFEVWLLRPGTEWKSLGILATPDEESKLRVNEVRAPSLVFSWNAVHAEDEKVRVGDRIIAVNEATDVESMLSEIGQHEPGSYLKLTIEPGSGLQDVNFGFSCDVVDSVHACPAEPCAGPGFFCGYQRR